MLDNAVVFQPSERFPHRCAREAESVADVFFAEPITGRKPARSQFRKQRMVGLFTT